MTCSSFEKVILLDDDAWPARDPAVIFDWPEVRRTGTLFFHDMTGVSNNNPIWEIMDVNPIPGASQESGFVYIDKAIAWKALYLTTWMNVNGNTFHRILWGDKDTFFIAAASLKLPYTFVPYGPYTIGRDNHLHSFLQAGLDGKVLFLHLVSGKKHIFDNLRRGKTPFDQVVSYDPNFCRITGLAPGSLTASCTSQGHQNKILPAEDFIPGMSDAILKIFEQSTEDAKNAGIFNDD